MGSEEFEILFKKLYPVLCRNALLLVNDRDVAEDIVQEQFAYLWENWHKHNIHSKEDYLFKAVRNKSINYLKSYPKRNGKRLDDINANLIPADTVDPNEQGDLQKLIHQAMAQLPEAERVLQLTVEQDETSIYINVRDKGKGIEREKLQKIFTHGFTTKENGHGFGLHSSAIYMAAMNGRIWADSDGPGHGACFVLQFKKG